MDPQQLPGEKLRHYRNFLTYAHLGSERSLAKTAAVTGYHIQTMFQQSHKHDWVKRAKLYDDAILLEDGKRFEEQRLAAELLRQKRELERRDKVWELAESIGRRAVSFLKQVEENPNSAPPIDWFSLARLADIMEKLSRSAIESKEQQNQEEDPAKAKRIAGNFVLFAEEKNETTEPIDFVDAPKPTLTEQIESVIQEHE